MSGRIDRRTALAAVAMAMTVGCARARPIRPVLKLAPALWASYKARFFHAEGRIVDSGNGGVSHSEGQGYGLLFAQSAGDRAGFEALLGWTERTLARQDVDLFSWRYVPGPSDPVPDRNNATDGDVLIAWALLRAGRQWRNAAWLARSAAIRKTVLGRLVIRQAGLEVLLPALEGFRQADHVTLNPSYYVWPALDAFADGDDGAWNGLIADGKRLLAKARFGAGGLPADWIELTSAGAVTMAIDHPKRFGFEAVRIPLYQMLSGRRPDTATVRRFWNSYKGVVPPAWIDLESNEAAPYPLSTGGRAVLAKLNGGKSNLDPGDRDYYSATLALLASMVPA